MSRRFPCMRRSRLVKGSFITAHTRLNASGCFVHLAYLLNPSTLPNPQMAPGKESRRVRKLALEVDRLLQKGNRRLDILFHVHLLTHPHCLPVRLGCGGCSFPFGRTPMWLPRAPHLAHTTLLANHGTSVSPGHFDTSTKPWCRALLLPVTGRCKGSCDSVAFTACD